MSRIRKLLYGIILIAIIPTLYLAKKACSPTEPPRDEKLLHVAISAAIQSLDPILAQDYYSIKEIGKMYEGLLTYHYLKRPVELTPSLAAAMPSVSEDQRIYTFTLRQGVRFQDNRCFPSGKGRELTAYDFVYSIKRLADPKQGSINFGLLEGKIIGLDAWRKKYTDAERPDYNEEIAGLVALDKHTLQITLTQPWPQFLYILTAAPCSVVPHEAVTFYKEEFGNNPVGTGPFVISSFAPSAPTLTYYKNPTFHDTFFPSEAAPEYQHMHSYAGKKLPLIDKIITHILPEEQPRWLLFNKGDLDMIDISRDMVAKTVIQQNALIPALHDKGIQLYKEPEVETSFIVMNHTDPVFKDNLALRKAFAAAFDGQQYIELFHHEVAIPAQSALPFGIAGYNKEYVNAHQQYDLEKAKQYLTEAGYKDGKGLPIITLDVASTIDARQKGEFMQKCMSKIGVRLQVIPNSFPELLKKINKGTTMMHTISWCAFYPDAEIFLKLFYSKNQVGIGINYHHAAYDTLYEQAVNMPDSPARTKLYEQLKQFIVDQVPVIYTIHPLILSLYHSWLKNYCCATFQTGIEMYLDIDTNQKRKGTEHNTSK